MKKILFLMIAGSSLVFAGSTQIAVDNVRADALKRAEDGLNHLNDASKKIEESIKRHEGLGDLIKAKFEEVAKDLNLRKEQVNTKISEIKTKIQGFDNASYDSKIEELKKKFEKAKANKVFLKELETIKTRITQAELAAKGDELKLAITNATKDLDAESDYKKKGDVLLKLIDEHKKAADDFKKAPSRNPAEKKSKEAKLKAEKDKLEELKKGYEDFFKEVGDKKVSRKSKEKAIQAEEALKAFEKQKEIYDIAIDEIKNLSVEAKNIADLMLLANSAAIQAAKTESGKETLDKAKNLVEKEAPEVVDQSVHADSN